MVRKWMGQNKLTLTEALGDSVSAHDAKLAEEIYDKCGSKKGEFLRMNRGEFNPSLMNANPDELLT